MKFMDCPSVRITGVYIKCSSLFVTLKLYGSLVGGFLYHAEHFDGWVESLLGMDLYWR